MRRLPRRGPVSRGPTAPPPRTAAGLHAHNTPFTPRCGLQAGARRAAPFSVTAGSSGGTTNQSAVPSAPSSHEGPGTWRCGSTLLRRSGETAPPLACPAAQGMCTGAAVPRRPSLRPLASDRTRRTPPHAMQFAAAGTAIGVSLEDNTARIRSLPPWVDTVILAAGAVSALCAAAAICCHAVRCCSQPQPCCGDEQASGSKALTTAAVLSAVGLLAQAAMLTCVTGEQCVERGVCASACLPGQLCTQPDMHLLCCCTS